MNSLSSLFSSVSQYGMIAAGLYLSFQLHKILIERIGKFLSGDETISVRELINTSKAIGVMLLAIIIIPTLVTISLSVSLELWKPELLKLNAEWSSILVDINNQPVTLSDDALIYTPADNTGLTLEGTE